MNVKQDFSFSEVTGYISSIISLLPLSPDQLCLCKLLPLPRAMPEVKEV
jgi:hypothetical protein